MVSGAGVLALSRVLTRGLDLIRVLTIARWLGPAEMGTYAVAALIVSTLDQFTQTGLRTALIQKRGEIQEYLSPVRTLQACRGLVVGTLIFFAGPNIATTFGTARSEGVVKAISLLPVLRGFETLFSTVATRHLRLHVVVGLEIASAAVGLAIGLAASYRRPDAWALVWAALGSAAFTVIASHVLATPDLLKFSMRWHRLRDLRSFSLWVFTTSLLSFAFTRGGDWVIGHQLDAASLAIYQMAFLLATLANGELGSVVAQIGLPAYSRLQDKPHALAKTFTYSFGLVTIVSIGVAGIICVSTRDFVRVVLGARWAPMEPLVPWLATWGVCSIAASNMGKLFHALGRPRRWAGTVGAMAALLGLGIYPMTESFGALGVALLLALIGVVMQFVRYFLLAQVLPLRSRVLLQQVALPTLACAAVSVAVVVLRRVLWPSPGIAGLVVSATTFSVGYATSLVLLGRWLNPPVQEVLRSLAGPRVARPPLAAVARDEP